MNSRTRSLVTAVALGHFVCSLVLLRLGAQWGFVDSAQAGLLHIALFPGWLVYFLLGPTHIVSLLIAYPLNSLLWGFAIVWFRRNFRLRKTH